MAEQHSLSKLNRVDAAVIVAVCLLLVLLVPVLFARPREQAVRTVCAANLGQIGTAMLMYAGDSDGALPCASGLNAVWGATRDWIAPDRRSISRDVIHGDAWGLFPPIGPAWIPANNNDSILVHDPNVFPPRAGSRY